MRLSVRPRYISAPAAAYLLPETHRLSVSGGDYLGAIISELMRGPDDTNDCARLPSSSQYMREAPEIITSSDGSKIAVISLKGAAGDYFDRNGISTALAFGSMTRICGFVPNVDGVLYDIDGIVVNRLYDSQGRLMYTFADIMRRAISIRWWAMHGHAVLSGQRLFGGRARVRRHAAL